MGVLSVCYHKTLEADVEGGDPDYFELMTPEKSGRTMDPVSRVVIVFRLQKS